MTKILFFLIFRTYHKDSYITQRRGECLGQEGRYRRTSSPNTSATPFPKSFSCNSQVNTNHQNVVGLSAKEDFHRSLLQDDKSVDGRDEITNIHTDPRIGLQSPQPDLVSVTSGKCSLFSAIIYIPLNTGILYIYTTIHHSTFFKY